MKYAGKKVIVTGANRSIGQGIATAFAKEGADVVISYRSDSEGAKQTIATIDQCGQKGKALFADFSNTQGISAFFDEALQFLGSVDILVNNAADYNTDYFLDLDVDDFSKLFQINVTAPMFLTQLAAKHMIEKKIPGSIINISATTGVRPYPSRVAHATGKAALNMLTKTCALDLAKYNIRVNAIASGSAPYSDEDAKKVAKEIPLQRYGRPKDLAAAALFIASDEASWMTGEITVMDGGHSLAY